MTYASKALTLLAATCFASSVGAQEVRPRTGPVIHSAGPVYAVPNPTFATPTDLTYKVAFEIANGADSPERMNSQLGTVARFLNMHAQAGVARSQVHVAAVVHGTAGKDLLADAAYRERYGTDNPNSELIRELIEAGAQIVLCGQTAAARGIDRERLIPGVAVSLSAMTALFAFQESGYRINLW